MTLESTLVPLTALDAVNQMLHSIGQGAIESIEFSESIDAEKAKTSLRNASRSVQTRGWWFNRERDYPLLPAGDGTIALPNNTLEFFPNPEWRHCVERARKLYDTTNHTGVFDSTTVVKGTLTVLLAYEDLPAAAREYIAARAGREFQINFGDQVLHAFTEEMEQKAEIGMQRAHLRAERPNAITDNYSTFRIARVGRR